MTETICSYETDKTEGLEILNKLSSIKIRNEREFEAVSLLKVELKKGLKSRIDQWEKLREDAYKSYQNILREREKDCSPFEQGIQKCQEEMDRWVTEKKKKADEEQQRREALEKEKIEAQRQKLLEKAVTAEAEGNEIKVMKLLEKADQLYPEPVVIPVELPKGTKRDVIIKVLDIKLLCAQISKGVIPDTVIKVDEGKLKKWVLTCNKMKDEVPSIFIEETYKTSVRG